MPNELTAEKRATLKELPHPGGLVPDGGSFCSYHGKLDTLHCPKCDDLVGYNRAAEQNAARIRALQAELKQLGVETGPIRSLGEGDPGPNEAKPVMTNEEKVAELRRQAAELGAVL